MVNSGRTGQYGTKFTPLGKTRCEMIGKLEDYAIVVNFYSDPNFIDIIINVAIHFNLKCSKPDQLFLQDMFSNSLNRLSGKPVNFRINN